MRKLSVLLLSLAMVSGFPAASTDYDGPEDRPHIMNQPDQAPDTPDGQPDNLGGQGKGVLPSMPDLPGQASDTAKQVINSIGDAFQGGVQGLGDRLSNLLGGQPETNSTS